MHEVEIEIVARSKFVRPEGRIGPAAPNLTDLKPGGSTMGQVIEC